MKLSGIAAGLAGASLLVTSSIAQAAPVARDASPAAESSWLEGDNTLLWIGLALALGIGLLLILDDDEEGPESP